MMNLCLTIIGIVLYYITSNWVYMFLVFIVFFINEVVYNLFNIDIYHSHDRTELMYSSGSITEIISTDLQNVSSNLTEGFYPDKTKLSPEEAEISRFNEFIRILDIKPGDYVLDAGCGFGGLVMHLRKHGINAYGMTITKHQYMENVKNHGDYFYYGDYTKFHSELKNRFDYIILPGSLEHPFGGNHHFDFAYERKYLGMRKIFSFMKHYFKKDSPKKKIFCTCLHSNYKFKDSIQFYLMERSAGCLYPPTEQYSVADSLKDAGYDVVLNEDYTWHYYFATVCDPNHFGNPMDIGVFFTFITLWLYPIIVYIYYGGINGMWMWMFDGKWHSADNPDFSFVENMNERPCTLFYTVAQIPGTIEVLNQDTSKEQEEVMNTLEIEPIVVSTDSD